MFENLSEKEARELILNSVTEYYKKYKTQSPYSEGDKISYASRVYDENEMTNLVDSALDFWLTEGKYCRQFEKEFGDFLGVKHVSIVNSGSSANLLAFMALTSPLLGDRRIRRGDEVITVAASFPTTISPIVQYGAVPVMLDITIPELNIDTTNLEKAYSSRTKAVMLAHTLGNAFNIKAVKEFCDRHNLWLIEDNCDSLGSTYTLNGETKLLGTFGDIGTSSFYPPHHMTMGEGGAVYTDNDLLHKIIRSLRDWGRDCSCPSGMDNTCNHRFDGQYGNLPAGYDHKYVYSHFGYNLKATEMQASVGCAQLSNLPGFTSKRRENFKMLYSRLKLLEDKFILPQEEENCDPSWFGFALTCKEGISREKIVRYCEEKGVQTRMLFSGNIVSQPLFDDIRDDTSAYRVVGDLSATDKVMNDTFWIGVYPGMTEDKIDYMVKTITEAVNLL